jgi:hypothetical protein
MKADLTPNDAQVYEQLKYELRNSGGHVPGSSCQLAFDSPADPSSFYRVGAFEKLDGALRDQNA